MKGLNKTIMLSILSSSVKLKISEDLQLRREGSRYFTESSSILADWWKKMK